MCTHNYMKLMNNKDIILKKKQRVKIIKYVTIIVETSKGDKKN